MTDSIQTARVHPEHVSGPNSLIVSTDFAPWGEHKFGVTFDQAEALANHLLAAVKTFREHGPHYPEPFEPDWDMGSAAQRVARREGFSDGVDDSITVEEAQEAIRWVRGANLTSTGWREQVLDVVRNGGDGWRAHALELLRHPALWIADDR